MPEISDLTEWVELQAATTANDTAGDPVETWTTYRACWAEAKPGATPSEPFVGPEVQARLWVVFTIREPGVPVLPTHRLLWRGEAYDIVGPFPDPTRTWLRITTVQHRSGVPA